jgi:hypothetical protein
LNVEEDTLASPDNKVCADPIEDRLEAAVAIIEWQL